MKLVQLPETGDRLQPVFDSFPVFQFPSFRVSQFPSCSSNSAFRAAMWAAKVSWQSNFRPRKVGVSSYPGGWPQKLSCGSAFPPLSSGSSVKVVITHLVLLGWTFKVFTQRPTSSSAYRSSALSSGPSEISPAPPGTAERSRSACRRSRLRGSRARCFVFSCGGLSLHNLGQKRPEFLNFSVKVCQIRGEKWNSMILMVLWAVFTGSVPTTCFAKLRPCTRRLTKFTTPFANTSVLRLSESASKILTLSRNFGTVTKRTFTWMTKLIVKNSGYMGSSKW